MQFTALHLGIALNTLKIKLPIWIFFPIQLNSSKGSHPLIIKLDLKISLLTFPVNSFNLFSLSIECKLIPPDLVKDF